MNYKRKGEKPVYSFVDAACIGRACWAPGMYQHRSPLPGGGSRNTGSPDTPCCMKRAYHGCPDGPVGRTEEDCHECHGEGTVPVKNFAGEGPMFQTCPICRGYMKVTVAGLPLYRIELAKERKLRGWRKV